MTQYEKMFYEILINYIPKISGVLEDIVVELKRINSEKESWRIDKLELKKLIRIDMILSYCIYFFINLWIEL